MEDNERAYKLSKESAIMKINTQAELSANINSGEVLEIVAAGIFSATLSGSAAPHIVVAHTQAVVSVEAWGSSQPRVEAWESSQPRVEARGSSQPRVVAWGSSQPRVVAWGYAQLSVRGHVVAQCAQNVAVLIEAGATVEGGKQTFVQRSTPAEWCDYYGVAVVNGVATVFKAVGDDYRSPRGADYTPGTTPVAPDWDGGIAECGGGLHFSPTPAMR